MRKEIEKALSQKIGTDEKSSSGRSLFFPENMLSEKYRNLFGIEDLVFDKAFGIVTGGVGNELSKINSLTSSSLLSLLVFYPLFSKDANNSLTLLVNGNLTSFTKCFFEVRNKVIRRPSCVDVVLQSEDKKTLLFLESKFMEYEDITTNATYGKSYYTNNIGKHGNEIVKHIREWCRESHKNDEGKEITILAYPLTYQDDIPSKYKDQLPQKIRDFYGF